MYSHWNNLFLNHAASYSLIHRFVCTWSRYLSWKWHDALHHIKPAQAPYHPCHSVGRCHCKKTTAQLERTFPTQDAGWEMLGEWALVQLLPVPQTVQTWANHFRAAPKTVPWLPERVKPVIAWLALPRIRLFTIHPCSYYITLKQKQQKLESR